MFNSNLPGSEPWVIYWHKIDSQNCQMNLDQISHNLHICYKHCKTANVTEICTICVKQLITIYIL